MDSPAVPAVFERDLISFDDDPIEHAWPQPQPALRAPEPPAATLTRPSLSETTLPAPTPRVPPVTKSSATLIPSPGLLSSPAAIIDVLKVSNTLDMETVSLTPRTYQRKLFELARERNIIAVMNTGSGKTLVAVMLIKDVLDKEAARALQPTLASTPSPTSSSPPPTRRRLCFFVVNSVPLVFQQAAVIRTQCTARVEEYCGDMRTDYMSKTLWDRKLDETDVIVLTAQILADVLQHGFLKITDISLLIFDECHHARNDHPYHNIMRNYYHTAPEACRPKVFGMTASPSSGSAAQLAWCALELERNLDATIYTADVETVRIFVPQPKEVILTYRRYPITHLVSQFMKTFGISSVTNGVSAFNIMSTVLSNLGPWCMSRLLQKQRQQEIGTIEVDVPPLPDPQLTNGIFQTTDTAATTTMTTSSSDLWQQSAMSLHQQRRPRFCVEDMTPKVMKLIQLLWESIKKFGEEFCGIIFVERRYTAYALGELLRELEMFEGFLRVGLLVGHGSGGKDSKDRSVRMTFSEQNRIIAGFRNKTFNLLVATRVAEEGLDIPSCNVVVRFDPVESAISYIQSRGRARQHQSLFVLLQEHENRKEEASLERLLSEVRNMNVWSQQLEDGKVLRLSPDLDRDIPLDNTKYMRSYVVPSTGAKLTMDSAVALVYHYCSKLHTDEFSSSRPEFDITAGGASGYICQVTLPAGAPIRKLESDVASTKNMAKKSAAFKACEQLHRLGALNDHLLPVVEDIEVVKAKQQGPAKQGVNASHTYPIGVPSFWTPLKPDLLDNTVTLYASIIRLSDSDQEEVGRGLYRALCMLTAQPLQTAFPPIQLFVDGHERKVLVHQVPSYIKLTVDEANQLCRFTLEMFARISRRKYECDMSNVTYVMAPLLSNSRFANGKQDYEFALQRDEIAWHAVSLLIGDPNSLTPLAEDDLHDSGPDAYDYIVTTKANKNSDHLIKSIFHHIDLDSDVSQAGFGNLVEDHRRLILRKLAMGTAATAAESVEPDVSSVNDAPQLSEQTSLTFQEYLRDKHHWTGPIRGPIALLERTKRFRNHLQPIVQTVEKDEASVSFLCALDQCLCTPVVASVLRMFTLLPSAFVRLDAYLRAYDMQVKLGLTEIPVDTMLRALTTPSANMSTQYERLELLGDSFLKFSITIRLYIVNPSKDEGQLHLSRIHIVSNHALLQHARRLNLYKYVCSTPFYRKTWRPVGCTADGDSWDEYASKHFTHVLSNKTMADIVEATLGAAFLTGGVELGLKAAKALLIPFPEFENWLSFKQVHRAPPLQPAIIERNRVNIEGAEKTLGYKFKNPMLFLEAMTHASTLSTDATCYQRLEFLGDAVLDFQVVRQYYDLYPDAEPGTIVLAKDASVSNRILGALSIDLGLFRYLDQFSAGLMSTVANAVVAVEEFKLNQERKRVERGQLAPISGDPYDETLTHDELEEEFNFWLNISMPKVLGDLVESTIGAIFVDSGFDYAVINDVFQRLIWPFIARHVNFDDVATHPTKALLEWMQAYGCLDFRYDAKEVANPMPAMQGRMGTPSSSATAKVFEVSFYVHGEIITTVQAPHSEQCKKETSAEVLRVLKADPGLLDRVCTCAKRRKKPNKSPGTTPTAKAGAISAMDKQATTHVTEPVDLLG